MCGRMYCYESKVMFSVWFIILVLSGLGSILYVDKSLCRINEPTCKSLFWSITTFLTAFPEKLTKYSGIWELDILKFLATTWTNQTSQAEGKNWLSEPCSQEFWRELDSNIWVPGQSVTMPPTPPFPIALLHTHALLLIVHMQCKGAHGTYWKALCMCPLRLWSLHNRLFLWGDKRQWSRQRVTTPHDTTAASLNLHTPPRAVNSRVLFHWPQMKINKWVSLENPAQSHPHDWTHTHRLMQRSKVWLLSFHSLHAICSCTRVVHIYLSACLANHRAAQLCEGGEKKGSASSVPPSLGPI